MRGVRLVYFELPPNEGSQLGLVVGRIRAIAFPDMFAASTVFSAFGLAYLASVPAVLIGLSWYFAHTRADRLQNLACGFLTALIFPVTVIRLGGGDRPGSFVDDYFAAVIWSASMVGCVVGIACSILCRGIVRRLTGRST